MILDIILILLIIIVGVIGYKIGFLPTLIKLTSALSGLIIAICFTQPITDFVVECGWDNAIEERVYTNITSSEAFTSYIEGGEGVEGINGLLQELGMPPFVSSFVAGGIADVVDPIQIAQDISSGISYVFVFVIVFVFLLIFSSLIFWILKLIIKSVRKNVVAIRVIDGILGIVFYILIFMIILYIALLVISLVLQTASSDSEFVQFFTEQLHLNDDEFGIVKYLYENNIIGNFFGLLF